MPTQRQQDIQSTINFAIQWDTQMSTAFENASNQEGIMDATVNDTDGLPDLLRNLESMKSIFLAYCANPPA